MKHYQYLSLAAIAAITGLASCSNEDTPAPASSDGMTTFNLTIPAETLTRYGEGELAKSLKIAVYEACAEGEAPLMSNFDGDDAGIVIAANPFTTTGSNGLLQATVQLQLIKNKSYDIVFWAQSADCTAYTYDATSRTISVSYDNMEAYDENRDAFYSSLSSYVSTGTGATVTLTRPFAQINVGTSDYAAYTAAGGSKTDTFGMTVTGVSDLLNLSTGEISASADNLKATVTPAAPSDEAFPVNASDLTYLAMGYVLVGSHEQPKATLDVTLNAGTDGSAVSEYSNVPAQRDYRTNIYGALLTNKEDVTVDIDPSWQTPDSNIQYADGVYNISSPEGLQEFATNISNGTKNYAGETVVLTSDIDMTGVKWTSPGDVLNNSDAKKLFAGTFDGQGHTISNLTSEVSGLYYQAGFLGCIRGNVKNLTIKNFKVNGTDGRYIGAIAAYLSVAALDDMEPPVIENCHVDGMEVTAQPTLASKEPYVGGLVGYPQAGTGTKFIDCSVNNFTATAKSNLGGLIGIAVGSYFTDCTVTNSTLVTTSGTNCGVYYGKLGSYGRATGCSFSDVTINGEAATAQ